MQLLAAAVPCGCNWPPDINAEARRGEFCLLDVVICRGPRVPVNTDAHPRTSAGHQRVGSVGQGNAERSRV